MSEELNQEQQELAPIPQQPAGALTMWNDTKLMNAAWRTALRIRSSPHRQPDPRKTNLQMWTMTASCRSSLGLGVR